MMADNPTAATASRHQGGGLARSLHRRQPVRPVAALTPLDGEEPGLCKVAKQGSVL